MPFHLTPLVAFWKGKTLADVTAANCRAYVAGRPVKAATARRELETLAAAIRHAAREHGTPVALVSLPPKAPPRDRWLSRAEAAALLRAAWRQGNHHLARFILLALYTGTRAAAVLALQWTANTTGGWVDLERGVLYRRAAGEQQTRKRRPPAKLHPRLAAHLRRWRALDGGAGPIVHWRATGVAKVRRAWDGAREAAGLGPEVTPHVLRHTCTTWLVQAGVPMWEVAGYVGVSVKTIEAVYGHHDPAFQGRAVAAF